MSTWKEGNRPSLKPLPSPNNIIHEVTHRGMRIVQTDDRRLVGSAHPDSYGFSINTGFIVLDEFDEHVLPLGAHWHYSPDDAALAIEMHDVIMPTLKEGQKATTFLYEYGTMRQYRREFWHTYHAIAKIQQLCDDAVQFDENPQEAIRQVLHDLRQNVAREVTARGEKRQAGTP